ncbi:MAG: hypothetical protein V1850_06175 [Candidatus Bathyarchaeota archaeon]
MQEDRVNEAFRASESYQKLILGITEDLRNHIALVKYELQYARDRQSKLEGKISTSQEELGDIMKNLNETNSHIQDVKSKEILLAFQLDKAKNEIDGLKKELDSAYMEMTELKPLAEKAEPRIDTNRNVSEISTELNITDVHIDMLKDVSDNVEKNYQNYLKTYNELKEKIDVVVENRERALSEVDNRKGVWKNLLDAILDRVNQTFTTYLDRIKAKGLVTISSAQDMRDAGLEMLVGFKGVEPQSIDSGSHSGGERSAATMAFLLALQRHIKSPFRAVDEFDAHMDPMNRETISRILLSEMEKETESQYLTITPGQLTEVRESIHVITVQRIEGSSEIRTVSENMQNETSEETTDSRKQLNKKIRQ